MADEATAGQELVHLTVDGGVATITLDSPHNRNALSVRLRRQLRDRVRVSLTDDRARVLVLTHTGPVFCSGADLTEARDSPDAVGPGEEFSEVLEALWTSPKPVVGRLAGPARAGGIGLVAACDLAVAVKDATFAFPEVRIGVVPAVISVPLRHRVVPHALHRLFLTGETFDAAHAVEIGLLSGTAAPDGLDAAVRTLVDMLLLGAPGALAATKQVLRAPAPSLAGELAVMQALSARHFSSAEGQEGIAARAEKRPAAWVRALEA